jgi:hypothetical protein
MDDEDTAGDDVQSILTFGAKALFEEGEEAHDIICMSFVQTLCFVSTGCHHRYG